MIALSDPGWLQVAFSTLVGMFDLVGMRKNIGKTVEMVCHLCQAAGTQFEAAYERKMTGAGLSYQERQKVILQCLECRENMELRSRTFHLYMQNGKSTGGIRH